MKKYFFVIIAFFAIVVSCKKNNTTNKSETPLKALVSSQVIDSIYSVEDLIQFELGYSFFPTKKGRITKLGAYMPVKGSYRVVL